MSDLVQVTNWLNILTASSVENTLVEAGHMPLQTTGKTLTRVWIVETVAQVLMLNRALDLAGEALDLRVEPLRRIMAVSKVMEEGGLSKSEEDFEECEDIS